SGSARRSPWSASMRRPAVATARDTSASPGGAAGELQFSVRPGRTSDVVSFLDLWRAVVGERRFVRTETVTRSLRFYRRRFFRHPWTADEASIVAVAG